LKDKELGTKGMKEVIQEYFIKDGKTLIDCLVKLSPFFIMSTKGSTVNSSDCAEQGTGLLKELDVPLIQPIASSYMTLEEWEKSNGLSNDIGWSVALPEFEGVSQDREMDTA
jgi:cobaltochelatase CobN